MLYSTEERKNHKAVEQHEGEYMTISFLVDLTESLWYYHL